MFLFPAVDIKDGECVRLLRGDMEQATVFSNDPAGQAKLFESEGAEWIHVVDLNGAFAGEPVNIEAVRGIINNINIPVQLGGGIRDIDTIEAWLEEGVSRIILGTIAQKKPELVKEACQRFPGKIAVGIDAKDGKVAIEGWAEKTDISALELALKFEDAGASCIIYTNVNHDGIMEGPDLQGIRDLAEAISTPVIASGGISSLEDLEALKTLEPYGVIGAVAGRAIYDGAISIKDAVAVLK